MKRETEDPNHQIVRIGRQALQFFRRQHAVERLQQCRQCYRQGYVVQQPAQIFQCVRYALQKMDFALVESAKAVRSQRLHDADVDVSVVMLHELFTLNVNKPWSATR